MKLTKETKTIIQSFAGMNNSMIFHEGSRIRTTDKSGKVLAYATIDVEFPTQFAIYDVGNWLSVINLVDDANLKFEDKRVVIHNNAERLNYVYGNEDFIDEPPETINYPDDAPGTAPEAMTNIHFELTEAQIDKITKACSMLSVDEIAVQSKKGEDTIKVSAVDTENEDSSDYSITVGATREDSEFRLVFKAERWSYLLPQDYRVSINCEGISRFLGTDVDYYMTLQSSTEFESA